MTVLLQHLRPFASLHLAQEIVYRARDLLFFRVYDIFGSGAEGRVTQHTAVFYMLGLLWK